MKENLLRLLALGKRSAAKFVSGKLGINGSVETSYTRGIVAKNGEGGKRNIREAYLRFMEGAEEGHLRSKAELAECYSRV